MNVRETSGEDFAALQVAERAIYHQRGAYAVRGHDGAWLRPVNRTYLRATDGAWDRAYGRHHVPTDVDPAVGEVVVSIYGQPYLFLREDVITETIPAQWSPGTSDDAVVHHVMAHITARVRPAVPGAEIGVHGSHQVGLAGPRSDLDLVAWCTTPERPCLLAAVDGALGDLGFAPMSRTTTGAGHARRYAARLSLDPSVGRYIADRRNRWQASDGRKVSLQCVQTDADAQRLCQVVADGVASESGVGRHIETEVTATGIGFDSNHPRLWPVRLASGQDAVVLSLSWVHQCMGPTAGEEAVGAPLVVRGALHEIASQPPHIVLWSDRDFLLPVEVARAVGG